MMISVECIQAQEGWVRAEWGTTEKKREARFYSLTAKGRKQLAQELNYTGDPNDSASMNVWLHKQVLIKISENGGKVPEDLLR